MGGPNGGESHTPAFFCYAWATNLFNDGLFHGAVWDVLVDSAVLSSKPPFKNQRHVGKPAHEIFVQSNDVYMQGMWIVADRYVPQGEARFYAWRREDEALPPNRLRPANPSYQVLRNVQ